jgi:hypothetical protein
MSIIPWDSGASGSNSFRHPTPTSDHMGYDSLQCQMYITKLVERTSRYSQSGCKFLPEDEFDIYTSEESIRRTLNAAGLPEPTVSALVKRIQRPKMPAQRIYLTIMRIGELTRLQPLLSSTCSFSDNDLPLSLEMDSEDRSVIHSCSNPSSTGPREFFSATSWSHYKMEEFERSQHYFLAPVLDSKRFEYDLTSDTPLPLVTKNVHIPSNFSTVYKVTLHPFHLGDIGVLIYHTASQNIETLAHPILGPLDHAILRTQTSMQRKRPGDNTSL